MSKAYGRQPSAYMFPSMRNPLWIYAFDNLVFQIGDESEQKEFTDLEIVKLEHYSGLVTDSFNALVKMFSRR